MDCVELWQDISGYDGIYAISNFGRIKSVERLVSRRTSEMIVRERIRKLNTGRNGYAVVSLYNNGIGKAYLVHRLVASAFIKNPENKREVNHIDCNKLNNFVDNLEWATPSENTKHAYDNGLIVVPNNGKFGFDNSLGKRITQMTADGKVVNKYGSMCEAERNTGIFQANISKVCSGERSMAGGYMWSYSSDNT